MNQPITTKEQAEQLARRLELSAIEARHVARIIRRNWQAVLTRSDVVMRISKLVEAVQ